MCKTHCNNNKWEPLSLILSQFSYKMLHSTERERARKERACYNISIQQLPLMFVMGCLFFCERSDKSDAAMWHAYNILAALAATLQKQYSELQYGFWYFCARNCDDTARLACTKVVEIISAKKNMTKCVECIDNAISNGIRRNNLLNFKDKQLQFSEKN